MLRNFTEYSGLALGLIAVLLSAPSHAQEVKERFAKGEINKEEFEEKRDILMR
jgi:hypothetical protein